MNGPQVREPTAERREDKSSREGVAPLLCHVRRVALVTNFLTRGILPLFRSIEQLFIATDSEKTTHSTDRASFSFDLIHVHVRDLFDDGFAGLGGRFGGITKYAVLGNRFESLAE